MIDDAVDTRPTPAMLVPEIRAFLATENLVTPEALSHLRIDERRAIADETLRSFWGAREPVAGVEELVIDTGRTVLPGRLYRSAEAAGTVLFIPGGGWVVGNIDTHDGCCRALANLTPCNVVSVSYRKGPEFPFPTAVDDVEGTFIWLLKHGTALGIDTRRIVVAGESAGGNLATVLARRARDAKLPVAGQVLAYPVTDTAMDTRSYRDFGSDFNLTASTMEWFFNQYLPEGADRRHPDAAPLQAKDLSNLAPALIITAECDPLRDEGRAYASRLVAVGNQVTYVEWRRMIHGFWLMNAVTPSTKQVIALTGKWLRDLWSNVDERNGREP